MSFCTNCGKLIPDGANFCDGCGASCVVSDKEERKGDVYKCPNCGEPLKSFVAVCPSCNYELRDFSASVQKLYEKLEVVVSIDEKAMLIRNYPVPNTKEDILEFMILASSNINGETHKNLFDAWVSKFEQTYNKAKMVLKNDYCYEQIEEIYKKTKINIAKGRTSHIINSIKKTSLALYKIMPNSVFAIVTIGLIILNIIHLINGSFAGINIIFTAMILGVTYSITEKKHKTTNKNVVSTDKNNGFANQPLKSEKAEVKIPFSLVGGTTENYIKVEQLFIGAGFTNVKVVPLDDLTFGIKNKVGEVDDIIIDGKEISAYFRRKFNSDVPVVITYHSIRKQ